MGLRTFLGLKKRKPENLRRQERLEREASRWQGPYSAGLWGQIEANLHHHPGITPRHSLNIYAQNSAYRLGREPLPWLDESNCTLTRELWSVEQLSKIERVHGRDTPRNEQAPVIVLDLDGRLALIDGSTRVNKWTKAGEGRLHPVIIIRPNTVPRDSSLQIVATRAEHD